MKYLNISYKACLRVLNFFSFCFWKTLYYSFNSEWQLYQVEYSRLEGFLLVSFVCFIFLSTLNISWYTLLECKASTEKSPESLMGVPLYIASCFSLASFKSLSLSLTFEILIMSCFGYLWVHFYLELSILPGYGCVFPSPC